jgi:hypothetical protein
MQYTCDAGCCYDGDSDICFTEANPGGYSLFSARSKAKLDSSLDMKSKEELWAMPLP